MYRHPVAPLPVFVFGVERRELRGIGRKIDQLALPTARPERSQLDVRRLGVALRTAAKRSPATLSASVYDTPITLYSPSATVRAAPVCGSSQPTTVPSMRRAQYRMPSPRQSIQVMLWSIPGVMLRASPPAAGTMNTSPAIFPSSLITPEMNAILPLSGDQRSRPNWFAIVQTCFSAPPSTETVYNWALYQPCIGLGCDETTSASVRPSGERVLVDVNVAGRDRAERPRRYVDEPHAVEGGLRVDHNRVRVGGFLGVQRAAVQERDRTAVRQPDRFVHVAAQIGQRLRFAAVDIDHVKLLFLRVGAVGNERHPFAVRRPARRFVGARAASGQAALRPGCDVHQMNRLFVRVVGIRPVAARQHVSQPLPAWRKLHVTGMHEIKRGIDPEFCLHDVLSSVKIGDVPSGKS
ncbi:MAG: hypothetical protein U0521_14060 [Anaerolineae bacterium]